MNTITFLFLLFGNPNSAAIDYKKTIAQDTISVDYWKKKAKEAVQSESYQRKLAIRAVSDTHDLQKAVADLKKKLEECQKGKN